MMGIASGGNIGHKVTIALIDKRKYRNRTSSFAAVSVIENMNPIIRTLQRKERKIVPKAHYFPSHTAR